jgi:hypothetical protein
MWDLGMVTGFLYYWFASPPAVDDHHNESRHGRICGHRHCLLFAIWHLKRINTHMNYTRKEETETHQHFKHLSAA